MAEAGWHPKREAKRFEPPPWEREQFEALQQAQDEPQTVDDRPLAQEPASAEEGSGAAETLIAELAAAKETAEARQAAAEAAAAVQVAAKPRPRKASGLPDAQVDAMLIQLGAEEPRVDEHLKPVGVFGSAVAMFFGACMFFWGLYALMTARGAIAAVIGALIVLGFGAVFGGLGLWFGWRVTNRGE